MPLRPARAPPAICSWTPSSLPFSACSRDPSPFYSADMCPAYPAVTAAFLSFDPSHFFILVFQHLSLLHNHQFGCLDINSFCTSSLSICHLAPQLVTILRNEVFIE